MLREFRKVSTSLQAATDHCITISSKQQSNFSTTSALLNSFPSNPINDSLWCISSVFHRIDLVFLLHQLADDGWTIFLDCSKKIWRDGKWGCDRYRKIVSVKSGSSPWTILILLPHWSVKRWRRENILMSNFHDAVNFI